MRVLINKPTMEIALTRKNLTQKEFAQKLNVSSGYRIADDKRKALYTSCDQKEDTAVPAGIYL